MRTIYILVHPVVRHAPIERSELVSVRDRGVVLVPPSGEARAQKRAVQQGLATASHDRNKDESVRAGIAEDELNAIFQASVFWFIAPAYKGGRGAWFEFGVATAIARLTEQIMQASSIKLDKRIVVASGPEAKASLFSSASPIMCLDTHEEAFRFITEP